MQDADAALRETNDLLNQREPANPREKQTEGQDFTSWNAALSRARLRMRPTAHTAKFARISIYRAEAVWLRVQSARPVASGAGRVVVVARERKGRTVTTVTKSEADGLAFVESVASPTATIHADEASHWDALHAKYVTKRINHSEAYSWNGACTNQAESFLAGLRRMVMGQHHHVSPQYLYQFANEAAWKEDHRRLSNGELSYRKLDLAMAHPVSRVWAGYWQRSM